MSFTEQKINGLWYAVFENGFTLGGFASAHIARIEGNAWNQRQMIGGK